MSKKTESKASSCCGPNKNPLSCCKVESVITIDNKGQIVLPKDVREKLGFNAGEKIALIVQTGQDGNPCCVSLIKADLLSDLVKGFLGPLLK
jgi:antitoxin PrlF